MKYLLIFLYCLISVALITIIVIFVNRLFEKIRFKRKSSINREVYEVLSSSSYLDEPTIVAMVQGMGIKIKKDEVYESLMEQSREGAVSITLDRDSPISYNPISKRERYLYKKTSVPHNHVDFST